MPNPCLSLRSDQLIPVNKVVNKKEQLEKGMEEEEKNTVVGFSNNIKRFEKRGVTAPI
jgi:hypothetical protein